MSTISSCVPVSRRLYPVFVVIALLAVSSPLAAQTIGMVVDWGNPSVTVFEADTDTILGTVPIPVFGRLSSDCSIALDEGLGFVTDFRSQLWVVDLAELDLAAGVNPIRLSNRGEDTSLSPDGRFLAVCDGALVQPVSVVDIATRVEVDTFYLGHDCNAVEVCDDGSVLVTSLLAQSVRRLVLDSAGSLSDTGETLSLAGQPNDVACAPGSGSGVVVTRFGSQFQSFALPGLTPVDTRSPSGAFGISSAFDDGGDKVFVRSNNSGYVDRFAVDSASGVLGASRELSIPVLNTPTLFGVDQVAVHPDGSKLYVSQPGSLDVYDAASGAFLSSLSTPGMITPTGICLASLGPSILEVLMDIKPDSQKNPINPGSNGVIPVALLTTSVADGDTQDFDAWQVDPSTLAFGPDGAPIAHSSAHAGDVDGDGDLDMMLHFRTQESGIACGQTEAMLTGQTVDGQEIVGSDQIRTVGCKKAFKFARH